MASRILTDYFTWNVLSWGMLFLFTVIAVGFIQLLIIKKYSNGMVYKETVNNDLFPNTSSEKNKSSSVLFIDNCINIWLNAAQSDVAAIIMLILFFAVAVIYH